MRDATGLLVLSRSTLVGYVAKLYLSKMYLNPLIICRQRTSMQSGRGQSAGAAASLHTRDW